jgi:predicted transcriptional regulator
MDNTSRVAQWRQRMWDEGKEAVTLWLRHDTKLRLEDLASVWHTTTSEMIEQALAQFHPGNPPRIGNDTDTAQIQALMQDMVRAILPELREQMLQELRGDMAVADMNGNVTVTEPANTPAPRSARGTNILTPTQAAEMRGKRSAGVPIKALMQEYGISKATVHRYLKER